MNVSYKYLGVLLLGLLIVVLPLVAWHYALHDTLQAWLKCRRISAQLEQMGPATQTNRPVRTSDRELILSGELLDIVRQAASSEVRVIGYEPLVNQEQNGAAVHTGQLTLSGEYRSLLRVADAIERTYPQCRLRSLVWRCGTNPATRREQLTAVLYIQQIMIKR